MHKKFNMLSNNLSTFRYKKEKKVQYTISIKYFDKTS